MEQSEEIDQVAEVSDWKRFEAEEYKQVVRTLVHFSSKTVNSNATASGVRLAKEDALNLPYVSARTLLNSGVRLRLDYLEGGANQAGKFKQVNAVVGEAEFAKGALPEERKAIFDALADAEKSRYETGLTLVDSRLRQLLVPREGSPGEDYVSLTPITSSGVCHYILDSDGGLVKIHNISARENKNAGNQDLRLIRQAQFGIGGSNPQNIGCLVRSMTRPIFVKAPGSHSSLKQAFSFFYRGIRISFFPGSPGWDLLEEYRVLRSMIAEEHSRLSPMELRNEEKRIISAIVTSFLVRGSEALECLRLHCHELPKDHLLQEGEYELVSRRVPGVIRGMIDHRLREFDYGGSEDGRPINWPREAAKYIALSISTAKRKVQGELVPLIPLDKWGRNSLISMMENALR